MDSDYPYGSHLRSSRMAPCLSIGRLPSLTKASELRDVEIKCKAGTDTVQAGEIGDGLEDCVDRPGASQEAAGGDIVNRCSSMLTQM